jgi:hypothetical protein
MVSCKTFENQTSQVADGEKQDKLKERRKTDHRELSQRTALETRRETQ